jgi:hypothetical protein
MWGITGGIFDMTTYTNIAKPTNTTYTNISGGSYVYDDSTITFDSSAIQYDGTSGSYTNIVKPIGILTFINGVTQGLLIPLTYTTSVLSDGYTKVNKPT